jgi:sortase A
MRDFASHFLILSGILILTVSAFVLWRRNDPTRLQFSGANVPVSTSSGSFAEPTGIMIESLQLRLPIVSAGKKGNQWETTSQGVSYLRLTPKPGEPGNSILYGHNWGSILGDLYKVRPGEILEIYFSGGKVRKFEVDNIVEVAPSDTYILAQTEEAKLTLYTCSGFLDQKRLVVTAFLI